MVASKNEKEAEEQTIWTGAKLAELYTHLFSFFFLPPDSTHVQRAKNESIRENRWAPSHRILKLKISRERLTERIQLKTTRQFPYHSAFSYIIIIILIIILIIMEFLLSSRFYIFQRAGILSSSVSQMAINPGRSSKWHQVFS